MESLREHFVVLREAHSLTLKAVAESRSFFKKKGEKSSKIPHNPNLTQYDMAKASSPANK